MLPARYILALLVVAAGWGRLGAAQNQAMVTKKWAMFLFSSTLCIQTMAAHFNGGTIQWRPRDAENFDGMIEVTHRIAWRRIQSECTSSDIGTTRLFFGDSPGLLCRSGCNGTVGTLDYFCTDFDIDNDWQSGERTYTYNIGTSVTNFEASYTGCCLRSLIVSTGRSHDWEIRVKGDLSPRQDNGRINSSPVTTTTPTVSLQAGCTQTVSIPVQDTDQDIVRCRWATGNECADVCDTVPGAILDSDTCELTWDVNGTIGLYAVAIQVEDFISPTSTVALSSVPLLFLINVFSNNQPCAGGIRPSLVAGETPQHNSIFTLFLDTTYTAGLVADSGGSNVSIVRFITASPFGLNTSSVEQSLYNSQHYYANVTWIPGTNQTRQRQIFCFRAVSSNGLESEQSCITLDAVESLVIKPKTRSGECGVSEAATLTGIVSLPPSIYTNHVITYSWTGPGGQRITGSSEDVSVSGGTLVVDSLSTNTGRYVITACLTIPGTDVMHCSSAAFTISTDMPGQVDDPVCPNSSDGGVLNIRWQQPTTNAGSVNDYVVEVQEIIHSPPGSRMLGVQSLTPPFRQEVQSGGTLMAAVTSGVEALTPYNVSVMPRNPAGCGDIITITCFTQAGGQGVPVVPPADVRIFRSHDFSAVTVTWRPFTLVEARGFIEYIVQLRVAPSVKRQNGLTQRVPMDRSSTTFTGLDVSVDYKASVGTRNSVSGDAVGPVSERVSVPATQSSLTSIPTAATQSSLSLTSILIAVGVVVVLVVAMVLVTIIIIFALRSRRSALDLTKQSRSSPTDICQMNSLALEDSHHYENPISESPSSEGFNVTSCPAYSPTTISAHLDSEQEYAEVRMPTVRGKGSQAPASISGPGEKGQSSEAYYMNHRN